MDKSLDKFRTCTRARPYPEQNLPSEFYIKEHSKPLFNKNKILNLKNLYFYPDCITILYLRGFYMINNLDLESTTQQAMH